MPSGHATEKPFDRGNCAEISAEETSGDIPLAHLLSDRRLSVETTLQIGAQVAAELAELHARDVIHRAIYPDNVLIDTATCTAKLLDFAAAALHVHGSESMYHLDGTAIPLAYISPEQTGRMNRQIDYRTDFYSFGASLYHALAGRPPFDLMDPLSIVHAHIASAPRPLSELDARIPEQVSKIVEKLLARGPARFDTGCVDLGRLEN